MNATRTTVSDVLWRWQRGVARALLVMGALAGMTLGTVAHAQIAFRAASSATQPVPTFRAAAQTAGAAAGTISFPVAAGAQVAVGANSSFSVAIPAGVQDDDFAVLIIAGRPIDTTEPAAPTTPRTWTFRSSRLVEVGTADLKIMTFYLVLTSADAGAIVTVSVPAAWSGTGRGMSGQIAVWRGVDTTTPFDVADVTGSSVAVQDWVPPSITTATNGAWVVSAVATSDDNALSVFTAQGFTARMSGAAYDTTAGGDHSVGLADVLQATAGTPTMLTWRQTLLNNDLWAGITFALRPAPLSLTIPKPAGTATDDVMIASFGYRTNQPGLSSDIGITPPSGWTLVRRLDNPGTPNTDSGLAVYRKVAGASEPASYSWGLSCAATCATYGFQAAEGGIVSFSNVDITAASPINVENGVYTVAGAQTTPDVTTSVANAMLVTSHEWATAGTWTPPTGMTEAVDVTSGNQATEMSYVLQAAAGPTGPKQATPSLDDDAGNAHILALRPAQQSSITINKPAGTIQNDVMIATIGFRPATLTVTPPVGWTLVRRIDTTDTSLGGAPSSLAVYSLAAGAAEPANYTWTASAAGYLAGGILTFSGADTTTPIDIDAGNCTLQGGCANLTLSHATPSVTTTMADTMLVTSHAYASAGTWIPPAGMTEVVDVQHGNQSLSAHYVLQAAAGATGTKTATASSDADIGTAHILALKPAPPVGGFNAYETSTGAGAITGVITTKRAGTTISLDVIALNAAKTAIATTFTGTVRVEVLNAADNSGALDGNNCRPTWTVIQTLSPDPTFIAGDNGRKTVSFTQANSYPNVRLRITYPAGAPTVTGCSLDNFAIRPDTLASFAVTDTDWQTAGTGRALNLLTFAATTPTHKAGRPVSVRATALNAAGTPATTTNYTGAPTATLTACVGAACTATFGTLTLTTTFVLGQLTSDVASYDNVGSFALQLIDSAFASVDAADTTGDCSATGRYVCSATLSVGRFVPDHFAVALNTPAFGTACGPFTYIGQAFNYATAPVITVTAQGFANNTTTLYNTLGSWFRITNADITPATQAARYSAATGTLDVTGLPAVGTDPVIASAGLGVGTLTFSSGTGLFFTRTTPVAPFDADISLAINVIDADGVILATNPARFGTATAGNGITFSSGKAMRFGRLAIRNANGSQLMPLPVQVEAQYWSGAPTNAFITNTQDSCTLIASANDAMGNYTSNLSDSPTCETAISGGGTLSAGRRTLQLAAPGSGNNGSVDLTVNLGASASGNTCTTLGGAPVSATTANLPHLQGNWTGGAYNVNPSARATFGVFKGAEEVIFVRENF